MAKRDKNKKQKSDTDTPDVVPVSLTENCSSSNVFSEQNDEPEAAEEVLESLSASSVEKEQTIPQIIKGPVLSNIIVQRYEGEKAGDVFHGEGVAVFQGGHVYKGSFAEGLMHGHGEYTWADGVKYEGEFVSNAPMGYGTYTWLDASTYEGEVCCGIRHGTGTYKCGKTTSVYKGQWHQGKRHGKGTIYFNKEGTSWYEGNWENNIREGWGVHCYPTGNIYEGQWKNNIRHGEGTMKWIQLGQQYSGQWVNGVQHGHGTHTWFLRRVSGSQYPLRNEYKGEFVQGLRHGQGTFSYASGAEYSGGWSHNKKHGQGKFIFKNGRIFEGEFIDDRMAEFPAFSIDGAKTPDLSGIRTHSPPSDSSDQPRRAKTSSGTSSLLGPDIVLNIEKLLKLIPEAQRDQELRQVCMVEFAIIRHIALLRAVYSFYSSLGHSPSPDNTFLLTWLQFWRFLKDCGVQLHGLTLAQLDRLTDGKYKEGVSPEEVHSPFSSMLLRNFISSIVITAYYIYHNDVGTSKNVLVECFSRLMRQNIIPNVKNVKGILFCHPLHAEIGMNYVDRCWEIYQVLSKSNNDAFFDRNMTTRQFIWMCRDLGLLDNVLTTSKVLEILSLENPAIYNTAHSNLNLEITFLEFFEALLVCAEMKNIHGIRTAEHCQSQQNGREDFGRTLTGVTRDSQRSSSQTESTMDSSVPIIFSCAGSATSLDIHPVILDQGIEPAPILASDANSVKFEMEANKDIPNCVSVKDDKQLCINTEPAEEMKHEGEVECWIQKTNHFFTQIFFPAYEHAILLKEEMRKEQLRQTEKHRTALEKAKANARPIYTHFCVDWIQNLRWSPTQLLTKQCEAEEEERREEKTGNFTNNDLNHSPPVLVTPVASSTSLGPKHSPTSGNKKKKK
ncbi:radial spoke head 10 homolog B isoform X3 [Hoplias malabaricus]|uniref:radial spoke head 10 homolog B isoform X3 n=1 Tax=Hoplias malabaricus TaxID=27720 RepID=UPI003461808C